MKACKYCDTRVEDSEQRCPSCGSNTFVHVCANCGNRFESAFCPNCGVKAGDEKKVCPDCGTTYFTNACPNCGYTRHRNREPEKTVHEEHVYVHHETEPTRQAPSVRNRSGCLTAFLWIFFLPVMLTIVIAKSRIMKGWVKAILILLIWGTALGVFQGNGRSTTGSTNYSSSYVRTTRPSARTTSAPVVTATPEPDVAKAQQAIDSYIASITTPSPDPETLTNAEKIMLSVYNRGIKAYKASYKKGRGSVDSPSTEPDYIGVIGYAAISSSQRIEKGDTLPETPWSVPVYQKDKQFWEKTGTIPHKTMIVVVDQELTKRSSYSSAGYKGHVQIIRLDTNEVCWLDVDNLVTSEYWNSDISEAIKQGYCLCTFDQKSDFYPVDRSGAKVELDDGIVVLAPMSNSHFNTSPDRKNNPIAAIVFKQWKNGFGGVFVFFNEADLTINY